MTPRRSPQPAPPGPEPRSIHAIPPVRRKHKNCETTLIPFPNTPAYPLDPLELKQSSQTESVSVARESPHVSRRLAPRGSGPVPRSHLLSAPDGVPGWAAVLLLCAARRKRKNCETTLIPFPDTPSYPLYPLEFNQLSQPSPHPAHPNPRLLHVVHAPRGISTFTTEPPACHSLQRRDYLRQMPPHQRGQQPGREGPPPRTQRPPRTH